MRLQVEIHRHMLPPVNIIFNTTSTNGPVKTISDLLTAVDKIIPLESTDGEWGLEDYIVQVAATSCQQNLYECLHYQLVKDVFREDDEVIVRGLTSDEIRERRQGGRLQILPDGRHLFDGVAWGRRHNSQAFRPGIVIPPRKRRRLLPQEEEEIAKEDESLQLDQFAHDTRFGTLFDDEDDQDEDDDYEYEYEEDEYEEEDDFDNDKENRPRQMMTSQEFDDADADSESSEQTSISDNDNFDGLEQDEVQLLLTEAGELEEAYNSLPLECRITSPARKRKHAEVDEYTTDEPGATFEGFSTPLKATTKPVIREAQELNQSPIQGMIGGHVVAEPVPTSDIKSTESKRSASKRDQMMRKLKIIRNDESDSSSDSSSSEESEVESEDDSDASTSSDDSDITSTSDSDDSEDPDSTSSSGESESLSGSEPEVIPILMHRADDPPKYSPKPASEPASAKKVDNPPGTGTKRTRTNNDRIKRRKRLSHLKAEGLLPPEAGFEALREYDREQVVDHHTATGSEIGPDEMQLTQRKEEMLARLNASYEETDNLVGGSALGQDANDPPQASSSIIADDHPSTISVSMVNAVDKARTLSETPQKRRLDVESTRRMLFSSLGLRNPKTPEAEQALREKLSKPIRMMQAKQQGSEESQIAKTYDDDSWKDKLIISAIECVQEGVIMSPPPFPFKQRWERTSQKKTLRMSAQSYPQHEETATLSTTNIVHPTISDTATFPDDSRTISAGITGVDDMPYPIDLSIYPDLTPHDTKAGAIIAYKQLELNAKFEPEASPYRVAQIVKVEDGLIDLILAARDRIHRNADLIDEDTGERIYEKFEMPSEEPRMEDDGLRESTFEDMISPKLIQASEVQVTNSTQGGGEVEEGTQSNEEPAFVPESVPVSTNLQMNVEGIEVDTPRRNEISNIIKSAGFNSAVDEQLLQPIDMPKTHAAYELSAKKIDKSSRQDRYASSRPNAIADNAWRSSPADAVQTSQANGLQGSEKADPSSPRYASMAEIVDYPHVSQIDINQSSLTDHAASSSHQDAQRVSPELFDIEHSNLSDLHLKNGTRLEQVSQVSSLATEIPQSQTKGRSPQEPGEKNDNNYKNSSTLRGGNASPPSDNGSDEGDSDNLPSLRSLISSQQERTRHGVKFRPSALNYSSGVSPPPLRKNRNSLLTNDGSADQPVHSAREIKISASQQPSISMSQIPVDTRVVDLTLSSDRVEQSHDEEEYHASPRTRRTAARLTKVNGSQDSSQGSNGAKRNTSSRLTVKRKRIGKARG